MEKRGIGLNGDLMSTQVASALMRELKTGIYADAEKLPAEMELAGQYGVSRTVIRDALAELEREGYVIWKTRASSSVCAAWGLW